MDELSSGSTLGRYELLVRLGRGGMASVWVAREKAATANKERLVAVKAMLPELAQHSDFRAMFLEEGQIVRSIEHPNVVTVHEVGEQSGILFMAMEWVEGDSLRAVIREARRRRPIPPEMAVRIIADAAAGLHAAHELRGWDGELRQLVHCDVSPHNILVGLDGHAKLVDFGVANATLHSDLSADERVKGKFAYMSPEQARGEKLDRRSDVFSLGIVLFELTTGERLFRGENPAHTLALVTTGVVPDPRRVHPEYPARLAEITLKALERDPKKRYQTAEALREALERYLVEERIVVSHGSVAQLVRRVLAPRVEALRQSLREALVARDGLVAEELIPEGRFGSISDASRGSGTPRPQTYPTPVPERSAFAPIIAALGGVAAAAASILWMLTRPGPAPLVATPVAATPAAIAPGAPKNSGEPPAPPQDPGVDISSLPIAAPPASDSAEPEPPPRPGARAVAPRRPGAESAAPAAKPAHPAPAGVKLEEQPSLLPGKPVLADAPPPPPASEVMKIPSAAEAAAFNRGAALAQLGSASGRAGACKRPGGPTGPGRVTVTFAPDGSASKVAVPAPFSGTATGACLSAAFAGVRVPAFTGSPVALPGSFRIPE
jgi:eukaryotic-like serine/threonine-protein kinase